MTPLLLYLLSAGVAGWSLHKKKWGVFFFSCAFMAWIVLIQILTVYQLHGSLN